MNRIAHVLVLLAAQPPDPGNPSIIPLGGAVGALVAGYAARLLHLPHERRGDLMTNGTLVGGGCGVLVYLATYLL